MAVLYVLCFYLKAMILIHLVRREGKEAFEKRMEQAHSLSEFLFDSLVPQSGFEHKEGNGKLYSLARPLIDQIPSETLRLYLLKRAWKFNGEIPILSRWIVYLVETRYITKHRINRQKTTYYTNAYFNCLVDTKSRVLPISATA